MFPSSTIKLNCDLGEGIDPWAMSQDAAMMPLIDQANIACDLHASDPLTMRRTVRLALEHGVSLGAHPGYPDRIGFGRRSMPFEHEGLVALLRHQVGALDAIVPRRGRAGGLREAARRSLQRHDAQPGHPARCAGGCDRTGRRARADGAGRRTWRAADPGGLRRPRLCPGRQPAAVRPARRGAVHESVEAIVGQAQRIARGEALLPEGGAMLMLGAASICVHGDTINALPALRALHEHLRPGP